MLGSQTHQTDIKKTSGNEIRVLCRLMSPVSRPRTKRLDLNHRKRLQLTYVLHLFSRVCDAHFTDASKKAFLGHVCHVTS